MTEKADKTDSGQSQTAADATPLKTDSAGQGPYARKKLPPHFVDEVMNIAISPNGACRLTFGTWNTDEQDQPVRIDTELIMTLQSLEKLSEALPKAIAQVKAQSRQAQEARQQSKH